MAAQWQFKGMGSNLKIRGVGGLGVGTVQRPKASVVKNVFQGLSQSVGLDCGLPHPTGPLEMLQALKTADCHFKDLRGI